MSKRVLLLHSDPSSGRALAKYFAKRGDRIWLTGDVAEACKLQVREKPDLVLVDLHLPEGAWQKALRCLVDGRQQAKVLITNQHPDLRREMQAKERGVRVFLRYPFTAEWIERSIKKLDEDGAPGSLTVVSSENLPPVRVPMRTKITVPYVFLALLFALVSSFLVSRYVLESIRDRFNRQLIDAGKLTADWMVQEEDRLLDTMRLAANTEGLAEAMKAGDSERVRELVLPLVINAKYPAVEVLGPGGASVFSAYSLRDADISDYTVFQGDTQLAEEDFVKRVLLRAIDPLGDKFAGVAYSQNDWYFYVCGPVYDLDGELSGVLAVGESLSMISQGIRRDTLAHISFYDFDGQLMTSTLFQANQELQLSMQQVGEVLLQQDEVSLIRPLQLASEKYSEILGPWEARGGTDMGIVGIALAENFLAKPSVMARAQVFGVVLLAVLGVVVLGVLLARQITNPLAQIVQAAIEVARGNLEVKVPSRGTDELMVLAHAFNHMISGLQEGFIYRDLLGRTVSPEVREALRHSFASGDLRLEGQSADATVLMSDIRGFTTLSEKEDPTTIFNWLNEYFRELVPVITKHGGVVDKFEGDAMLAFFGILPRPIDVHESAFQACQAAVEMLAVIEKVNERRRARGEPELITGIGINTGTLTAGGLGTADRLNYTIIGDTVNTTQRLQEVSRDFGESGVVISEGTLEALQGHREAFQIEPLGERAFKGKRELHWIYRLYSMQSERFQEEIA